MCQLIFYTLKEGLSWRPHANGIVSASVDTQEHTTGRSGHEVDGDDTLTYFTQ
jgi:hypothetical protein